MSTLGHEHLSTSPLQRHADNMLGVIRKKLLGSHIADVPLVLFHSLQLWWVGNGSCLFNLSFVFYLRKINKNVNGQNDGFHPNTTDNEPQISPVFSHIVSTVDMLTSTTGF